MKYRNKAHIWTVRHDPTGSFRPGAQFTTGDVQAILTTGNHTNRPAEWLPMGIILYFSGDNKHYTVAMAERFSRYDGKVIKARAFVECEYATPDGGGHTDVSCQTQTGRAIVRREGRLI